MYSIEQSTLSRNIYTNTLTKHRANSPISNNKTEFNIDCLCYFNALYMHRKQ